MGRSPSQGLWQGAGTEQNSTRSWLGPEEPSRPLPWSAGSTQVRCYPWPPALAIPGLVLALVSKLVSSHSFLRSKSSLFQAILAQGTTPTPISGIITFFIFFIALF